MYVDTSEIQPLSGTQLACYNVWLSVRRYEIRYTVHEMWDGTSTNIFLGLDSEVARAAEPMFPLYTPQLMK